MGSQEASAGDRNPGATTIAPEVLVTIARLSALGIPGVAHMARVPAGVNRLFSRNSGDGVHVDLTDGLVSVQLHLILEAEVNVREVSRKVQEEVARAIEHMVGMSVERVDVHIEDIDYRGAAES